RLIGKHDRIRTAPVDQIETAGDGVAILGMNDGRFQLWTESRHGARKEIPVPPAWLPEVGNLRFIPSDHLAAHSMDTFWWFDTEWHHVTLDNPIPPSQEGVDESVWSLYPVYSFQKPVLHAGWNVFEGEGGLASVNLSGESPQVDHCVWKEAWRSIRHTKPKWSRDVVTDWPGTMGGAWE
ncbi:MAG: hypothetical protein QM755_19795, partial [Luteolibacter sp.]